MVPGPRFPHTVPGAPPRLVDQKLGTTLAEGRFKPPAPRLCARRPRQGFADRRRPFSILLPRLISGKLSVEDLDIRFPPNMREETAEPVTVKA